MDHFQLGDLKNSPKKGTFTLNPTSPSGSSDAGHDPAAVAGPSSKSDGGGGLSSSTRASTDSSNGAPSMADSLGAIFETAYTSNPGKSKIHDNFAQYILDEF